MDKGKKRTDTANSGGGIFASKNILSLVQKVSEGRNKQLFVVILIIGILLMTIPGGVKNTSSDTRATTEELKLCEILSKIDGCGYVSAMITYNTPERYGEDKGEAKGAVIVADGADNIEVRNKISEAVQAALDLPPHKVRVYESKK